MRQVNDSLVFSPTDLVNHLSCRHLTGLEIERAHGRRDRPSYPDPAAELVAQHGELHEQRYLGALVDNGREVVEIVGDDPEERAAATVDAMRSGADVVYQATFSSDGWSGRADFLVRVDDGVASALGAHSYEVYDTKLARSAKASAVVQLAEYSHQLTRVQELEPERIHLVLGDNSVESFRLSDVAPYHRSVRAGFLDDVDGDLLGVYPEPVEHCARCPWRSTCRERRRVDDHLTLVADLGRTQARALEEAGIATLSQLATVAHGQTVAGMQSATRVRLHHQARLQFEARASDQHVYELLEPDGTSSGLEALPEPTDLDLFFDIEGDPFLGADGIEYLFGSIDTNAHYIERWASSVAEEKSMMEGFIDELTERLAAEPTMHVYHFGHYEPTTLKRLAARHGTREHELDELLRRKVFVDLHRLCRRALRASIDSYSIKRLETFYCEPRETDIGSGIESAVAFETWLGSDDRNDRALLEPIAEYNRDDCASASDLRDWLEGLRPELAERIGRPLGRPEPPTVDRSPEVLQIDDDVAVLQARLRDGVPDEPAERDEDQEARWKLSHLLTWHRREMRTEWWAYFDRLELDDVERLSHSECIADLDHIESHPQPKGGVVWHTYRFDPTQELKIRDGSNLIDPATEKAAGSVKVFDTEAGEIVLSRRSSNEAPHPQSLMVGGPPAPTAQEAALRRMATALLEVGPNAAGVGYRLLRRQPPNPPQLTAEAQSDLVAEACERALPLDGDFLAIQGPPGAGKTYTGAHIIPTLIENGKTVAICANSHAVINHLLREVLDNHPDLRVLKKGPPADDLPAVIFTQNYAEIDTALGAGELDIFAGTAFALCREQFVGSIDTLIIEEAGQMSLANALATSQVARNLILLGDPQQLNQPTKAAHPPGTNRSALFHLLDGHDTIPAELGMFLPETRRMHPALTRFISERFYDGRLGSHPLCEIQALETPAWAFTCNSSNTRTGRARRQRKLLSSKRPLDLSSGGPGQIKTGMTGRSSWTTSSSSLRTTHKFEPFVRVSQPGHASGLSTCSKAEKRPSSSTAWRRHQPTSRHAGWTSSTTSTASMSPSRAHKARPLLSATPGCCAPPASLRHR